MRIARHQRADPRIAGRVGVSVSEFVGGSREAKRGTCTAYLSRPRNPACAGRTTLPPTRTHAARLPLVAHATAHAHATHLTPFSDSVNRHG